MNTKTITSQLLFIVIVLYSCQGKQAVNDMRSKEVILKISDPNSYVEAGGQIFTKYYRSLRFSEEFMALDSSLNPISKSRFFQQLISGKYLPSRFALKDTIFYKLVPSSTESQDAIFITALAEKEYKYYKKEGTSLPPFDFTDLNGHHYTLDSFKGNFVLLKLWFIGCVPCVKEMPALNKLKERFDNRQDILFLSIAFDKKNELQKFLTTKKFLYPVVPQQREYILNELQILSFPTHIVLDRDSRIIKIVGSYEELESVVERLFEE